MSAIRNQLESRFAVFANWVYVHRFLAVGIMLLITAALAGQLSDLTIDTREESFFHENDPTLITYNHFRDQFGQDDMFFIAMQPEKGLTPAFLDTMNRLHSELEASVPFLDEVNSLINGRVVRAEGDTLIVEDLIPRPPQTINEHLRILKLIDRYPIYENLLVSPDRTLAMILVKARAVMPPAEDDLMAGFGQEATGNGETDRRYLSNDQNVEIDTVIRGIVDKYRGQEIDFYFAGNPVFVAELQRGLEKDLGLMIPLSFLLIIIFLAILFRRISGVVYPLIIVLLSLIASLGIMAILRIPISNAIMILPTFLIVVGVGDSVHILTIFYRNFQATGDKRVAIVNAVAYAGLPVLMTSLTTACGLLSFVWADVAIIAHLGYVAPMGVMLAFFYTLFLLPALIAIFPQKAARSFSDGKRTILDRLFDAIARATTRRPLAVAAVWVVVVMLAGVAAFSVRFSHNAMSWLPEESTIRIGTQLMDTINGGTIMLEVIVDSGRENGLHDPSLLARMAEASDEIPTLTAHNIRAGKVLSIADLLKETHRALNQDSDSAYIVPDNRQLIIQELILFESSGSDDLTELADSTYRTGRLSILAPFTDSILYKDYVDKIQGYLRKQFPHEAVTLTGHMSLFIGITKLFITSMFKSYLFALLVITLLMMVMIGRFRVGLLSMIANVVPIILIFGIMGIAGIPIDLMTVLIGSIVLGLVVDDTIHFLHHFRRAYETSGCMETAVSETLHNTGRALVITSIVLCGGFIIYTTAYLSCYVWFGVLVGCAVLFALAADLLLIPSLLTLTVSKESVVKADGPEDQPALASSN